MGCERASDGGWAADAGCREWAEKLVVVEHTTGKGMETTTLIVDKRLFYAPTVLLLAVCVLALGIALAVRRRRSK